MDVEELDLTDEFLSAFKNFGGPAYDCSCGREHIDIPYLTGQNKDNGDSEDETDREMTAYEEAAEKNDKLILRYDNESFEVMNIQGKNFVYGCECEGWKPYMNFIVQYRYEIKDFLLGMSQEVSRMAEQELIIKTLKDVNLG